MEKKLNNSIDEVVNYIINTKEYKDCIKYKELMDEDNNIKELVSKIKKLQKEYVRTEDKDIKDELDILEKELNNNDIYIKYNQNLEIVNQMISYVKDELNDYFDKLLNNESTL